MTPVLSRDGRPLPGRGGPGSRRIPPMSGEENPAGFGDYLAGRARWIAVAAFAAVAVAGVVRPNPNPPLGAIGAVVAVGAATLLVLRWQPQLLYAVVATAGIALLGDGSSSNIGWFAVCLITAWCVLTGSRRDGLTLVAVATIVFAAQWLLWPDPGWGAWLAGTALTVAFSLLARHERNLLGQLRLAQAGLTEQARGQERNRIARELHDVIGHTLTVSLLHVQSARLAVEHDPADAGCSRPPMRSAFGTTENITAS